MNIPKVCYFGFQFKFGRSDGQDIGQSMKFRRNPEYILTHIYAIRTSILPFQKPNLKNIGLNIQKNTHGVAYRISYDLIMNNMTVIYQ